MLINALFAIIFANGVSSTRIIGDLGKGGILPLEISLGDGSATVVSGQPYPPQLFFSPSINLYDFDKQLEARKVVDQDACYIRKFTGTLSQFEDLVSQSTEGGLAVTSQVSEDVSVRGEQIPPERLEATVGGKIAKFCSQYDVFWAGAGETVTAAGRSVKRLWKGSGGINAGWNQQTGFSVTAGVEFTFGK